MRKATILIVEDEAIVAEDLSQKLGRLGYEVSGITAHGEEAVTLARDRRPDLVLMDILLQGRMDGVEAADQIRRERLVPVIFLTAHSDRATLQRAKLTEPFGYILKPFEEMELETRIEMALYKHQAEARLREGEQKLALALRSAGMGAWWLDLREQKRDFDNQLCCYLGIDPARFAGTAEEFYGAVHPDDRDGIKAALDRTIATGAPYEVEYRAVWPDGSQHYIASRGQLARDAAGQPRFIDGLAWDITERKQAEDALRFVGERAWAPAGEDFFQALARYLAQSLGADFVCIDQLEHASLAARTLAVFTDGKFQDNISYTLKDTPCGDVVGKTICCFPKDVRGLFPKDAVLQEMRAEGYVGTTLWSAQGQPIGLIALIWRQPLADSRLATSILQLVAVGAAGELERRQAEAALRESEARLKVAEAVQSERRRLFDVLETLPAMICLLTPDYHVAFANRGFREKFGEAKGRRCYEYCFGRTEPCDFCESYNVLKTGQPHHWEVKGADGTVIDAYDFPFTDVDGTPMILEMDLDITERRQAEAELAEHRQHLQEMVADRTKELRAANEDLQKFNDCMVGRELRMIELKQEIDTLCAQFGQPLRYGYAPPEQER